MNTLVFDPNSAEPTPHRSVLLRILDTLAEWLMRQELRVISRSNPHD